MAVYLNDVVLDAGLTLMDTEIDYLYICNALPDTHTEASATFKIGYKATPTVSAAGDAGGGGRKITVTAITDGTIDSADTATHWALADTAATTLYAAGTLNAPVVVAIGTFTLTTFDITFPDAV